MRTKKRNLISSPKNEDSRVHKRSKDDENVGEANEAQQMINDNDDVEFELELELDDNSTEYLSNDEIDQQSKQEKKKEDDKMSEDSQQVAYFSF